MITLTTEEIALIEKFLKREIDNPIGEEAELMNKITEDALNLMSELKAEDELNGSLIQWYFNKYKAQQ